MARAETVALSFEADLSDLKRDLAQLPGITEKEAKGMVKGLEKGFLKAEKAAKKAAKASGSAWVKSSGKIDDSTKKTGAGLKRLGDAAGGPIGETAGRVEALSEAVMALNNPVGLAIVGAAALVASYVAVAAAIGAAVLVADDFIDDLEAIGRAPVVSDEQVEAIQRTNAALDAMGVIGKEATVILAGEFAPALETAATLTIALGLAALDTWRAFAEAIDVLAVVGDAIVTMILGPLDAVGAVLLHQVKMLGMLANAVGEDGLAADLQRASSEIIHLRESMKIEEMVDLANATLDGGGAFGEYGTRARDLITLMLATDDAVKKTTRSIGKQAVAVDEVAEFWRLAGERLTATLAALAQLEKMNTALLSPIDRLTYEYERQLDTIQALEAAHQNSAQVQASALETRLALETHYHDELLRMKAAEVAAYEAAALAEVNTTLAVGSQIVASGQAVMEAQIAAQDTTTEAGLAAAQKAYAMQKAMAIVQAMIDGALAVNRAIAQFGPPPSPLGIAAMAAAGVTTAATMATIAMQPAPSFPMGGLIPADHGLVGVSPGEAILNRGAVEQLGPQGVDELNRGRRTGPEVVVVNRYEHRIFDAFVADSLATDGPLRRAITASGGRPGHSRRGRR